MTTDIVPADQAIATPDPGAARSALAHLAATGDVSRMTDDQRAAFILYYCERLGLEAATGCVEIIEFYDNEQKRKVAKVYPKAEAAKQLGNLHRIRVETLGEEMVGRGHFKVVVRGHDSDGRTYDEVGYVSLTDRDGQLLAGNRYSNALMKCHTVAKRRLILGMIGLSAPPSPEDNPSVRRRYLGPHGELLEHPTEEDRHLNDHPRSAAISGRPRFETVAGADAAAQDDAPLRPRPEPARPPYQPNPEATFKPTDEDIRRWQAAYFVAVKATSLETDDARHRFVEQWTDGRTASLRNFFASATERQADELIEHARILADDERQAIELSQAEADAAHDDDDAEF